MNIIGIIPARMGSTRFPGKPMQEIAGLPMIGHVYYRAKLSTKLDEVYVATCDQEIFAYIRSIGGKAVMTRNNHERCTDRTAEALLLIEREMKCQFELVVMIQGDEPLLSPRAVDDVIEPFFEDDSIQVANLMGELTEEEAADRNEIKVVINKYSEALYFSRGLIPTPGRGEAVRWYKQICIIPFRRDYLLEYTQMEEGILERAESIDMLRILEAGERVKMIFTRENMYSVDTINDLKRVERIMIDDELRNVYQ